MSATNYRRPALAFLHTDMTVGETAVTAAAERHPGGLGVQYRIRLRLFPAEALQQRAQLSFAQVAAAFEKEFVLLFQVRSGYRG
jgi:hypothetical protein